MNRKALYGLGALLILGFAAFSLTSFRESLTPYVPFDQARTADRVVQVAGGLVHGSSSYDQADRTLHFTLSEKASGETLRVRYRGVKPSNFEDAVSVVAIGRYRSASREFEATNLLVKCPSKYQGLKDPGGDGSSPTRSYD